MSAFQHRCEHRCICMQDAHEAVFLSNGIFSLLLHKADPMHTVWKPLGEGFLSDCSHSLLLLPHLSKYLHVIQVYWFFFKQQTITDSMANIWMWFITRRVPKLIKRKRKKKKLIFLCFLWGTWLSQLVFLNSLWKFQSQPHHWGKEGKHRACS